MRVGPSGATTSSRIAPSPTLASCQAPFAPLVALMAVPTTVNVSGSMYVDYFSVSSQVARTQTLHSVTPELAVKLDVKGDFTVTR